MYEKFIRMRVGSFIFYYNPNPPNFNKPKLELKPKLQLELKIELEPKLKLELETRT